MRREKLLQLQKGFQSLNSAECEEVDVDRALDLVEEILQFTDELLDDIAKLEVRTKIVEEHQKVLEEKNLKIFEFLQSLIRLSYSDPEKALLLLQNMQISRHDNQLLN